MEPKEFDLEFPRGDTCPIQFDLTDINGEELDFSLNSTEIYFTMKKNFNTESYILQKKRTGINTNKITVEGSRCGFVIVPIDTCYLPYGKYVYDIQVKSSNYVKTLVIGTITLTKESTWKVNE